MKKQVFFLENYDTLLEGQKAAEYTYDAEEI